MHTVVEGTATGHTRSALQSPAAPSRSPPRPQVIPQLTRHPQHTFTGTAPAPDAVIVVDPGQQICSSPAHTQAAHRKCTLQ